MKNKLKGLSNVTSSIIESYDYNLTKGKLAIVFKTSPETVYIYRGVSKDYICGLVDADLRGDSIGTYINTGKATELTRWITITLEEYRFFTFDDSSAAPKTNVNENLFMSVSGALDVRL